MPAKRVTALDGIRGVAMMAVALGHISGTRNFPIEVGQLTAAIARLGTITFLIVSGFVITLSLLSEQRDTGRVSPGGFYLRRLIRIMPTYLTFLFSVYLLSVFGHIPSIGAMDWLSALTWTVNYNTNPPWLIGHLWSLSVQEQFYLLWPLIIGGLGIVGAKRAAVIAFLLAPAVRAALRWAPIDGLANMPNMFPAVADMIAIGCLLALYRNDLRANRFWQRLTDARNMPILLLFSLVVQYLARGYTVPRIVLVPLALIAMAAVIDGSMRSTGVRAKLLHWPPLIWLGTASYSFYLWQQVFLNRHSDADYTSFPVNIGLALSAAAISYLLIERPSMHWGRRFKARRQPGPLPA